MAVPPPFLGGAGFPSNNVACAEAYQSTTMPSFMLIHPTVWPHYTNVTHKTDRQTGQTQQSVALAEVYLRTKWHLNLSSPAVWRQRTWTIFFFGGGSWVPILHNVARAEAYKHAKFHLNPSNHLAQYTSVTDRQADRTDRQTDNGLIAYGEPFYKRSPKIGSPYAIGPLSSPVCL